MEIQITLPATDAKETVTQNQPETCLNKKNTLSTPVQMNTETRLECIALLNQIDILEDRLIKLEKKYNGQTQR